MLEARSQSPFLIEHLGIKGIKCKKLASENRKTLYKLPIQHIKFCLTYLGSCCVCICKITNRCSKIHQLPVGNQLTSYNQHARCNSNLTLFRMGIFRLLADGGRGRGVCVRGEVSYNDEPWHSITLHREDPKKIWYHVTHPLSSAEISIFSAKISKYFYIKKYRHRLHFNA